MTQPTLTDAHLAVPRGRTRSRRRRAPAVPAWRFRATRKAYGSVAELPAAVTDKLKSPKKRRQWLHVWNSSFARHHDESRAFAEAWAAVKKSLPPVIGVAGRALSALSADAVASPFRSDPTILAQLSDAEIPRFLATATHPDRLLVADVPLDLLTTVAHALPRAAVVDPPDGPVAVAVVAGVPVVVAGEPIAAAAWLDGAATVTAGVNHLDRFEGFEDDTRLPEVFRVGKRRLDRGTAGGVRVPFDHDPARLRTLRPDQLTTLLKALGDPTAGTPARVALRDLTAIQPEVSPARVARFLDRPPRREPLVVKLEGDALYVADGHSRLTAAWLGGADVADVRYLDLAAADELPLVVKALEPDRRLIFGWASIVTKGGVPIVDKQGDVIPVDELENAFYDYVLSSRDQGHMHRRTGVGRLVECMVFTREKQAALGVDLGHEGAWVGFYVDDDEVWAAHKRGELPEFSIGGVAASIPIDLP